MKVCDYIANYLSQIGVRYIHTIMGGGAASLNDSFGKHPKLKYIAYHSEAGASYSAFGEAKYTNKIAVVNPTTGIAGVNAMTGLLSAWQDSAPVLFISGNVPLKQTSRYQRSKGIHLRQLGVQENDIISLVSSITKYADVIDNAETLKYKLEYATYQCTSGRKGPCWLDIPSDIANMDFDFSKALGFTRPESFNENLDFNFIIDKISSANRPLVLVGNGVHVSETRDEFKKFIDTYQVPFVTTFLGIDLISSTHELNLGRIGVKGTRAANFALQQCDCLIVLGCSLTTVHVGYLADDFAKKAEKIVVDIDINNKLKELVKIDHFFHTDLKTFFKNVL